MTDAPRRRAYADTLPDLDPTAWIAPGAQIVGRVTLHDAVSVWYGAILRADGAELTIGSRTNIQDGSVLHADSDTGITTGTDVTIGHRAILHNCHLGNRVLIGMGAIVLNHAVLGDDVLVGAGAVIPEHADIPAGSLVLGLPGRIRRPLSDDERHHILDNAQHYIQLARQHASSDPHLSTATTQPVQ